MNLTEQSTTLETSEKQTIISSNRYHSDSKNSQHFNTSDKKLNLINREELTSRFTINHNEV